MPILLLTLEEEDAGLELAAKEVETADGTTLLSAPPMEPPAAPAACFRSKSLMIKSESLSLS